MIWLLSHHPPPISKFSLFVSLPVCRKLSLLKGVEETNHSTAKNLVLNK
jgi:hypothetical protein